MKSNYKKFIIGIALTALMAVPLVTGAQGIEPPTIDDDFTGGAEVTQVESLDDVQTILSRIVGWAQVFFYIVATLFIILAAFRYLTSGGDDEKVQAAKNMLIYSIVAIAIAAIAGGVVLIVRNFINAG
tara:strand:+ start:149 stop:532 length:384 start_codon:yes stop_codon:yes gene_type:complete